MYFVRVLYIFETNPKRNDWCLYMAVHQWPRIMTQCRHGGGSSRQRSCIRRPLLAVAGACEITLSLEKRIPGGVRQSAFQKILGHPGASWGYPASLLFLVKFCLLLKSQNPPRFAQKAPKTLPKTLPKRLSNSILCSNTRNVQKWYHYGTKTTFWLFAGLQKSSQNRCQNAFKISFILDTLLDP